MTSRIVILLGVAAAMLPGQSARPSPSKQPQPKPPTSLEEISERTGQLLIHDTYKLSPPKPLRGYLNMQALIVTNPITREKVKGFIIATMGVGEGAESAVAFLDEDEARGVLNAIGQIRSLADNGLPDGDRKIIFTSRGDFEVKAWVGRGGGTFSCAAGQSVGSTASFDGGEGFPGMAEFAEVLDGGIKLLDAK